MHPMELQGDVGHVESASFYLQTMLALMQYRCIVCAKCTIDLEIILDAPNGTPS
jgi:hypothetical protein